MVVFMSACNVTLKNRQLIYYGRYLPLVRWSRSPRHEQKQSMCLSARWQSDMHCTQQYVVSLDRKLNADSSGVNAVVVYKHLWSLERILVGNSQTKINFKPQNTLKCLKYPYPFKWGMTDDRWVFHKPIKDRNKGAFFELSSSKLASIAWSFCDSIAEFWHMIREYSLHLAPVYWIWW